ncbi:hypothetical protein BsWGS_21949 [Bradybaena similaris]
MHIYPLLVIVAGLLSYSPGGVAQMPVIYNICDSSGPVLVNVGPNSEPFYIRSPNFGNGGLYSNNLDCTLTITSGDEPVVLSFYARDFKVEDCCDPLCVNGVRFSSWFAGRTSSFILPENSTSTVFFHTDGSVTNTGFDIQVTIRRADNETVYQYVGYGYSPESVALVPTTYYPGMAYSDRCLLPPQPPADYGISTTTDDTTTVETTTEESDDTTTSSSIPVIYNICDSYEPIIVNVNETSDPFYIRSPNYGSGGFYSNGFYSNNLNCTLSLTSGDEPVVLSFYASVFQVEDCCDSLCVNGVRFSSWFSGRTSSFILPENSTSTVRFVTDYSVTYTGFNIQVTIRRADNEPVYQYVGYGYSPEGVSQVPTTYYPGMAYSDRCLLPPQPPGGYGLSTTTDDTTTVETTTEESDDTTTSNSEYDFYYLSNSQQPTIYINTSSAPFFILSPNYGSGPYFDSQFSSIVVRSEEEPLVLNVDIKDFEVEFQSYCGYDSLCVGGTTLCGDWLTGYRLQFILPENSDFTISFRTDGSAVRRGFKIEVSQESARRKIAHQPSSGIVSSSGTLTYTEEVYRPEYPYSDRCASPGSPTPQYTSESTAASTTPPPTYQDSCYSAAYVRELNEALDQAIAELYRVKRLLNQRK